MKTSQLPTKTMTKPQTSIAKGKSFENYIAEQIRNKGLDLNAKRSLGSGSTILEKADIDTDMMILGRNAGIEAKNVKTPHIKDWWKQAQLLEKLGREPVLVYKLGGESMGDAKVVIYLDTLLELIKHQNNAEIQSGVPKSDQYAVKDGIESLKKIIKILEKYTN